MVILSFKESTPEASIRGVSTEDKKKRYSRKLFYRNLCSLNTEGREKAFIGSPWLLAEDCKVTCGHR